MDLIEAQTRRDAEELQRLRQDLQVVGQQNEPTTPPENQENGFPSSFSRQNRISAAGVVSPLGVINRPSRAGSQVLVTSPPLERARAYQALTGGYAAQSVPGSRPESDGDEGQDEYNDSVLSLNHRSAAS